MYQRCVQQSERQYSLYPQHKFWWMLTSTRSVALASDCTHKKKIICLLSRISLSQTHTMNVANSIKQCSIISNLGIFDTLTSWLFVIVDMVLKSGFLMLWWWLSFSREEGKEFCCLTSSRYFTMNWVLISYRVIVSLFTLARLITFIRL